MAWTVISILLVQTAVCGMAALPVLLLWRYLLPWAASIGTVGVPIISLAIVPSYVMFALDLMFLSRSAPA